MLVAARGGTPVPEKAFMRARAIVRLLIFASVFSLPGCLVVTCSP